MAPKPAPKKSKIRRRTLMCDENIEERLASQRDIAKIKREIKEPEVDLNRDTEILETKLLRDMKDLEYRMTIKLGAMLAQFGQWRC